MRDSALRDAGDSMTSAWLAGNDYAGPVAKTVEGLARGGAGSSPAVQRIVGYVNGELDNGVTPERLYTVRKVLADKLGGRPQLGDDLSAATKQARAETMTMIKSIDEALDDASGGKWKPYLAEYGSKSSPVNDARALALIRKTFEKENAPQLAGVPYVTGHRLAGAIEKHGKNDFGETLSAGSRAGLQEVQDNIGKTEGLQKLMKLTGTSGGGSNTAMDLSSAAADAVTNALPISHVLPIINALTKRADGMTQAAMGDALRNPERFIAAVSKKLESGKPLTRTEESVLTLLRTAGSGAPLELTERQ
jgi:hypothetical protein